jgi:hypothetical protein
MRLDVQEALLEGMVRCLNRSMLALLPPHRRAWGDAIVAEQHYISSRWKRFRWAAGGTVMSAKELLRTLLSDRLTWAASLAFGILSAVIDLHSSTRWPHVGLLCAFGVMLACWRPKWAWRWIIPLALSLPAMVLVTNSWGPYAVDRFDVFYGIVPSTVGTLAGLALRLASRWVLHKPAGH